MHYLKSTHHIKSENMLVKNISHNAVLISYTYTYAYIYIHMYIHICVHMYANIYIHQNVYIHIHMYTYIYMHKMNYYLRFFCLSIFRFKKEWYINFPNHVNICESARVIRKMNFSLFVKLANDGSLFFQFVSKQCSLYLVVFASSNKMFLVLNTITGQT